MEATHVHFSKVETHHVLPALTLPHDGGGACKQGQHVGEAAGGPGV